jgi:hypothetical protein
MESAVKYNSIPQTNDPRKIPVSLSFARTFAPESLERLRLTDPVIRFINRLVSGTYDLMAGNSIVMKLPKGRGKTSLCAIMTRMAAERGVLVHFVDINTLILPCAVFDGIINHAKSASVKYKLVIIDNIDMCDNDSQNNISRFVDAYPNTVFVSTATVCYNMDESLRTKSRIAAIPNYSMTESTEILTGMIDAMMPQHAITPTAMENLIRKCDHNMRSMMNYIETVYLFGMTGEHMVGDDTIDRITDVNMDNLIHDFLDGLRRDAFADALDVIGRMTARGKSNIDILYAVFEYIRTHPVLTEVENLRLTKIIGKYIVLLNSCDDSLYMTFIVNDMMKVLEYSGATE